MIKPILVSNGIDNNFRDRDKLVSIAIDSPRIFDSFAFKMYIQIEPDSVSNMVQ